MKKSIYSYYKERLIEIGGSNRCLYLKSVTQKTTYDIGKILQGRNDKFAQFIDFLWNGGKTHFSLFSGKEKNSILENLDVQSRIETRKFDTNTTISNDLIKKAMQHEKFKKEESVKAYEAEIKRIVGIKRNNDELERETGMSDLYIGYPFVFGSINQGSKKTLIKAPLLLFPVKINIPDENTVDLYIDKSNSIQFNRALIYAYAQTKKINVDNIELEFDDLTKFKGASAIINYLESFGIKFDGSDYESKSIYSYDKFLEPAQDSPLSVRYAAILAKFPLTNAIFNDYTELEKKKLSNDAIIELLHPGKVKKTKKRKNNTPENNSLGIRSVKSLDHSQSEVVKEVSNCGNMVIYGPPGTGKSQTIVNIITDALSKDKKVLVVSQKKAALDVVFNRLGTLNSKAMLIADESKEKRAFYSRCLASHNDCIAHEVEDIQALEAEYDETQKKIEKEINILDSISETLCAKREFGLSLLQMYSSSVNLAKNSLDYNIHTMLNEEDAILKLNYNELRDTISEIKNNNIESLYYNYLVDKENNPIIDCLKENVDIETLSSVKQTLIDIQKSKKRPLNISSYPYYNQVLSHYYEMDNEKHRDLVVALEVRFERVKKGYFNVKPAEIKEKFISTKSTIDQYCKQFEFLNQVLSPEGYLSVIDNLLRGNYSYIKFVKEAVENYIALRDINSMLQRLDKNKIVILDFAYRASKSLQSFKDILSKLIEIRIYRETLKCEENYKNELANILNYEATCAKINKLKKELAAISARIFIAKTSLNYKNSYIVSEEGKNYLHQISKTQKFWPIRKTMEVHGQFLLNLFPCWLLSPENVSNLLPLHKNLFDLVIFDEASQVFIENTVPAIYRGKNIVVAGDSKQLRPSTTFIKRYLGTDTETIEDYSVQAALEVDSLLDLAVSRYKSANLTYHYRSKDRELIDFSNHAFYGGTLKISPNLSKNIKSKPIECIKVDGKWIDRKNVKEASRIVELLSDIFESRKENESIGIITFNSEQQSCICDAIDKEIVKNSKFRSNMLSENIRNENGEDVSIFVKNLENVQGEERDIIIFSVGYAENEQGKFYSNFGSLSAEGGENRLNVAITRAKKKIYIVSSIEAEELNAESAKNLGPKLLQKYLKYARAISDGDSSLANAILEEIDSGSSIHDSFTVPTTLPSIEDDITAKLEKLGYLVDTNIGDKDSRISIAVYDKDTDKYLLGVILDKDAYSTNNCAMERDVSTPEFLASRGWNLIRVWARDYWLYPNKVIKNITTLAEKAKVNKPFT